MFGPVEKRLLLTAGLLLWMGLLAVRVATAISRPHSESFPLRAVAQKQTSYDRAQVINRPFSLAFYDRVKPFTGSANPFYINPAQPPPPAPPPVVRQVNLIYQGSISTVAGDRTAFLKVGDQLLVGGIGTKVSAFFSIAEILPRSLSLRDPVGKTTILEFNAQKSVAIPIQ